MVKFHIINAISSYKAILERSTIAALRGIVSITHLKMNFPIDFGVGEVCGDQKLARQCYINSAHPKKSFSSTNSVNQVVEMDPRDIIELPKPPSHEPVEPVEEIALYLNDPEKVVKIGTKLPSELREDLIQTLR